MSPKNLCRKAGIVDGRTFGHKIQPLVYGQVVISYNYFCERHNTQLGFNDFVFIKYENIQVQSDADISV